METKFDLKEKLIIIADELDNLAGILMDKGTLDNEAAEIKKRVLRTLSEANHKIYNEIFNIF